MSSGVFLSHSESYLFQIINRFLTGKINRSEAAQLLNLSERSITRHAKKIKDKGIFGAKHGNFGKTPVICPQSKIQIPNFETETILSLSFNYYFRYLINATEILKEETLC